MERSGVLAGGNWIVDRIRMIDRYPEQDGLAHILEHSAGNGGSPYNLLKDLAKLGAAFPLTGVGRIGEDAEGEWILEDCRAHGIDVSRVRSGATAATSYTEVMTVRSSGRRTFFHYGGANRLLDVDDFPLATSRARILHLGYLLLLDRLDEVGPQGTTGAARLFEAARSLGFKISVDVVSEDSDRVPLVVGTALPLIDYLFVNELEAERITGVATRRGRSYDRGGFTRAAGVLIERGVGELACIHCPEGALIRMADGVEFWQGSVRVPAEQVVGTVGAGDALAAGMLFGIHEGWETSESLRLGICAAAASLFHASSSEGVRAWEECLRLAQRFGFRD